MAHYHFKNADTPTGVLATTRLSTRVLNALGELREAGHPIEVMEDSIQEGEDAAGEFVRIAVKGIKEPGFHYVPGVEDVLSKHGIAIAVWGQSIND